MNAIAPTNRRRPPDCWATRFPFPDPECVAAGDEYRELAIRCYAAAGMTDREIRDRMAMEDAA